MAVIVTKEIKKKRLLLVVFAILVLSSFGILYFGYFGGSSTPPPQAIQSQGAPNMANVSGNAGTEQVSDLKVKILEDARFQNLQLPPGVPIDTTTTGKSNPFSD